MGLRLNETARRTALQPLGELPRAINRAARFTARVWTSTSGSIAIPAAFAGPAVIVIALGAIDLSAVANAKGRLQDIADAAALAGAPALALATDGSVAREIAEGSVKAHMAEWRDAPTYVPAYEVISSGGQRALRVQLRANRQSFFVNLLPPGGWNFSGEATAASLSLVPLCVVVTGESRSKALNIKDKSRLAAPACMVHSNRDIEVEGGSLAASLVQAVTSARGLISPTANTGAVAIEDPFASLDLNLAKKYSCTATELSRTKIKVDSGTHTIPAGKHCGGIEAFGTARVILAPGDHLFLGGHLLVKQNARLEGEDVVVFFDKASKFEFNDQAMVDLDGRKSGPYAGMVMGGTRDNTQDFIISADHVGSLLGVIYVPSARLIVEGRSEVARDSAWTVIVANELQLKGSPSLFINANYSASDVPVPEGVGNRVGGSRLVR